MKSCIISLAYCFLAIVNHSGSSTASSPVNSLDTAKIGYFRKITAQYRLTNPDSAIYYAKQGIAWADKIGYEKGKAGLLQEMGNIYATYNSYHLAEQYLQRALAIYTSLGEEKAIADVYLAISAVKNQQGQHTAAIRHLQQSLQVYTARHDTANQIQTLLALGKAYENAGNFPRAIEQYKQTERLNAHRPFSNLSLRILQYESAFYEHTGNYNKALALLQEGILKSDAPRYATINIRLLNQAGVISAKLGDSSAALGFHKAGLEKAKSYGQPEAQVNAMLYMADILKKNFAAESLGHLDKALTIAHTLHNRQLVAEVYKSMAAVYRQQNDYQEALYALEQHHKLMDSLLVANKAREAAGLHTLFQLDEYKLRVQHKTFQRNIGLVAIGALLVLLAVIVLNSRRVKGLNKNLTQSNKVKDILFSILGHDLRGPLGTVEQGLTMAAEMPPAEQQSFIPLLTRKVQTIYGIVNALFEWSQTQLKGIPIQPEAFKPEDIIRKNVELLQAQADAKDLSINVRVPPEITVLADPNQFSTVIRNLLSNAIKFSNRGGNILIAARAGQPLTFFVQDNGVGIPAARLPGFFNELKVTFGTAGEKGTGIGLLLTQEFITANNGKIWVESGEGKGATFYFTLPAAPSAKVA